MLSQWFLKKSLLRHTLAMQHNFFFIIASATKSHNKSPGSLKKRNVVEIEDTFHEPRTVNKFENDLMVVASHAKIHGHGSIENDENILGKSENTPIANMRREELTANSYLIKNKEKTVKRERRSKSSKKIQRSKIEKVSTNGDLKSIFSEIHAAKHRLTRSDIRQLAKKAFIIATLKKLKQVKQSDKRSPINKKSSIGKKDGNKKPRKTKTITKQKKKSKRKSTKRSSHKTNKPMKEEQSDSMMSHINNINTNPVEIESNDKKSDPSMETPGAIPNGQKKKATGETENDGRDIKEEITAENTGNSEKQDETNDPKTDNLQGDPSNYKKPTFSMSGANDLNNETDSIGQVIQNGKDDKNKKSEFNEDVMKKEKKNSNPLSDENLFKNPSNLELKTLTLDKMSTPSPTTTITSSATSTPSPTQTTALMTIASTLPMTTTTPTKSEFVKTSKIVKKSMISSPPIDINDDFLNEFLTKEQAKKTDIPNADLENKIETLKSLLENTTPNNIPEKFLKDLPAGLRVIAWKKLLEKKKDQLNELKAHEKTKPVTININIDGEKTGTVDTSLTTPTETRGEASKKSIDNLMTIKPEDNNANNNNNPDHHVRYLQKHIKDARSLRKLIAKTLIGHCKSTGKRILEAFIAMDKALERAQTIAEIIGRKFHVDTDKIKTLVDDKEDDVVETFLKDIFTKL